MSNEIPLHGAIITHDFRCSLIASDLDHKITNVKLNN
jgi:hypothetical protein